MKIILTALLLTTSLSVSANNDCYGSGCLPTAVLQQVIKYPDRYSYQREQDKKELNLLRESNDISREQLEVEKSFNQRLSDEQGEK